MKTKRCKGPCGQVKELEEFHKSSGKKDGRHSYCKECAIANAKRDYQKRKKDVLPRMREYHRQTSRLNRLFVDVVKERLGCCNCVEDDPCCLDFHHPNGDKEKNVAYWAHCKSFTNMVAEINRCVCVCSNCHRKIHAGRIKKEFKTVVLDLKDAEELLSEVKQRK